MKCIELCVTKLIRMVITDKDIGMCKYLRNKKPQSQYYRNKVNLHIVMNNSLNILLENNQILF